MDTEQKTKTTTEEVEDTETIKTNKENENKPVSVFDEVTPEKSLTLNGDIIQTEVNPKKYIIAQIAKISVVFLMLALIIIQAVMSQFNNDNTENNGGDSDSVQVNNQTQSFEHETDFITEDITTTENSPDTTEPAITEPTENTENTGETETKEITKLNGYNTWTYNNGDKYEGDFANGIRSGQGTYTWANGIIYIGEFINGNPSENGEYIYPTENTENTTEIITTTPIPTSPPIIPTYPPIDRIIEKPADDFIQKMYENAIEIPESENKIEPSPDGRSVELQYGAVPLSDTIPEPYTYFRNIILLGDSVTLGFDLYRTKIQYNGEDILRDLTVIASGSYGTFSSSMEISDTTIHPRFGGKQTLPEDIISQKEAKYVLICLGLNDVGQISIESYISYYSSLINRIKEKSPDKTVVIMSVTPIVFGGQKTRLNNKTINDANNALLKFAKENNIPFIDYAAAIRDSQNNLYDDMSSDAYCHLTVSAYNRIIAYMLCHPLKD